MYFRQVEVQRTGIISKSLSDLSDHVIPAQIYPIYAVLF
jgi:hypothetical protein